VAGRQQQHPGATIWLIVMPTLRHLEVARHILEAVHRDGPQTPSDIRERWLATNGPRPQPEPVFYDGVVQMLLDPGRYVVLDDAGQLVLTADGQSVATGGDFILGR
jgi:hypothetical protein